MRVRRWIAGAWVTALVVVSVVGAGLPPETGVGLPDDTGPEGSAGLERLLEDATGTADRLSVSLAPVVHDPNRLLVVAASERAPYAGEARALDAFMEDGGTAVFFLATTAWNELLSTYGISLHGALLLSAQGGGSPRSIPVELPPSLGGGRLVLVNATAIVDPDPGIQTVTPPGELVLDLDGDGRVSLPPDTAGRFPLVAQIPVGEGSLVVVASGEAVLGAHIDRNLDALARLFSAVADDRSGLLDVSTHSLGLIDLIRGSAQAAVARIHASLWGIAGSLVAVGLAIYLAPRATATTGRTGSRLDEQTDATRRWLDGAP